MLTKKIWFGKRDQLTRSTYGDCYSLSTLRLFHLRLYQCCITSSNKPSVRPSDQTCQVALISTSKITTMTKKYSAQSLYEQFRNMLRNLFLGHVGKRNIWFNIRAWSWESTCSKGNVGIMGIEYTGNKGEWEWPLWRVSELAGRPS